MLVERAFDTGEVLLNYAEGPASEQALLMLHGVSARWQACLPLIPDLAMRWHVFALDFRGHGKSGRAPGHYSVGDYLKDSAAFVNQVIKKPLVIFGHSLGGRVALSLAVDMPDVVRAVIVADTPLTAESLSARQDFIGVFSAWRDLVVSGLSIDELVPELGNLPAAAPSEGSVLRFKHLPGWDEAYLRYTARCLLQVDPEILDTLASRAASSDYDLLDILAQVTCPVLFLQGNPSLGALLTEQDLKQALAKMKSAISVRIEGAGHDIHLQQAEPVRRALRNFLESL